MSAAENIKQAAAGATDSVRETAKSIDWGKVGTRALVATQVVAAVTGGILSGKKRADDPGVDAFYSITRLFAGGDNSPYHVASEVTKNTVSLKREFDSKKQS